MNYDNFFEFVNPKLDLFIAELAGRYRVHVSDLFLKVYLGQSIYKKYRENPLSIQQNIVYEACCPLFESYLEHGCKMIGNGHHVAQDLCKHFQDVAFGAK